ncbi:fasciclin domain-containing protein [Siccirubricoccus sp. KC 17139]|uniref:Fasciclin domain-containing protein n=1 Tax=Siccirubricoccus soli TaxID=2899147 RepID=A0ABT1D1C1_9PROT|nr:fasciclin domain-containing protein [Siccirubricoccus soli]MCO6415706.1 fasciclin domain-containing protein [Siccirubricoccus soli]MCP2681838.1 fasciclin domain-containing protein [Siccirubricoccus soli]
MQHRGLIAGAAAAALCLGGAAAHAQDCMAVMARNPQLSTFVGSLERTGVAELLRSPGPFTILAPTNAAIEQVPVNIRNDLMGSQPRDSFDPIRGPAVVNAHILDGKHMASETAGRQEIRMRTRNGNELILNRQPDGHYSITPGGGGFSAGGAHRIQPAHVVQADIPCSNGVVHIVDHVLVR